MRLDGSLCVGFATDKPLRGTRTRSRTASGSRAGPGRASTAPSEVGRAGRRPGRPGPPSAGATSFLEEGRETGSDALNGVNSAPKQQPLRLCPNTE